MNEIEDVFGEWTTWAHSSGHTKPNARIDNLGRPHHPLALPRGWQGVYGFRWEGAWLKVGEAGPNCSARWQSHHYGVNRATSTLAFSLVRYAHLATEESPQLPGLRDYLQSVGPDSIGEWMKGNTERVNFLIGAEVGKVGLNQLESIAHRLLKPVFEGRWRFGGPAA